MKPLDEKLEAAVNEYCDKMFPCEKPCDSFGVCDEMYKPVQPYQVFEYIL